MSTGGAGANSFVHSAGAIPDVENSCFRGRNAIDWPIAMKTDKLLLAGGVLLAVYLILKSIKQFIMLSITLLSLKIVWFFLIILFVLSSMKKRTP